jgi:hypothetical protein
MTPHTALSAVPIQPAQVAGLLDCLKRVPVGMRLDSEVLFGLARGIGCSDHETPALVVRIRATAMVFNDPRWLPWSAYFRACPNETHKTFDAVVLKIVAELPLTSALTFNANLFFQALLLLATPDGHG